MIETRLPNHRKLPNVNLILDEKRDRQRNGFEKDLFYKKFDFWLIVATVAVSVIAFFVLYFGGHKNLADYDAIARLNISRKIIDSITPGFAQLGGIWLPFPQVLFLPFIWNNFLWHTGLAGAIASMASFIVSAIFIYKTVFLITKNKLGGMIGWLVYVANVNILHLQTMAMSESFFLLTLVMIIYFLTRFAKGKNVLDLLYCALFVVLTTLTRYEGYALFAAASLSVAAVVLASYPSKGRQKIEGILVLFMTFAAFGIFLWSFYSFLIFKDPIYWLNLYSGNKQVIAIDPSSTVDATFPVSDPGRRITISNAFSIYSTAMLYMNGLLVSILAACAFLYILAKTAFDGARKKIDALVVPVVIMTICVFGFLIVGYFKGLIPSIETPAINLANLFDKSKNFSSSSNIRYGIITLPLMAIVVGLVYSKLRALAFLAIFLILFQFFTVFNTRLFLIFSLPTKANYSDFEYSKWFRKNYDGGLILVSSHRHEIFMFQTGLDYSNFIYEGNRQWWTNSLVEPTRHATWVVVDESLSGDAVNELLENKQSLTENFEVKYQEGSLKIYKKL